MAARHTVLIRYARARKRLRAALARGRSVAEDAVVTTRKVRSGHEWKKQSGLLFGRTSQNALAARRRHGVRRGYDASNAKKIRCVYIF